MSEPLLLLKFSPYRVGSTGVVGLCRRGSATQRVGGRLEPSYSTEDSATGARRTDSFPALPLISYGTSSKVLIRSKLQFPHQHLENAVVLTSLRCYED